MMQLTTAAQRVFSRVFALGGLAASLLTGLAGHAQTTAADAAGPLLTPAQFLGYELGSRFTPQADVNRYAAHVVAHRPAQMKLVRYGQTYEHRPLEVIEVASAANFARLDDVAHNNRRLAGLESGAASRQRPGRANWAEVL